MSKILYRVFYGLRSTTLTANAPFYHYTKLIHYPTKDCDDVVALVRSSKPIELDDLTIRKTHLVGESHGSSFYYAQDPQDLLDQLFTLPEFTEGKMPAMWVDLEQGIVQLPQCTNLHTSRDNRFICGPEVDNDGNGEFGGCVIDGYDVIESCPIRPYLGSPKDLNRKNFVKKELIRDIPFFIPINLSATILA